MPNPQRVRDAISKYLPFKVFTLLAYLISFASIFLWVIALPVIYLYHLLLCVTAWSVLSKRGKDIIVVSNGRLDDAFENEIIPLIENRALFLNYEERSSWPRLSLPVLLFHAFGPAPIPASFLPRCLPAVILVRKFRFPSQFSFGPPRYGQNHKTTEPSVVTRISALIGDKEASMGFRGLCPMLRRE
jgi:hypothetical protein